MPENEFEKKVSSEMQELKFKPSEQVWLRVEERIRKKNKRRVFIIIFLLAGLALLGYWQRSNLFGEKKNDIIKNEAPVTNTAEEKQTATEEKTKPSAPIKATEELKENKKPITVDKTKDDTIADKNISNANPTVSEKIQPKKSEMTRKTSNSSKNPVKNRTVIPQKKSNEAEIEVIQSDAA